VTPKGDKILYDLERKINDAVFPGLQGGPHDNAIAGKIMSKSIADMATYNN